MAQQTMYAASINSPQTELDSAIDAAQTTITLLDASVLPVAPNLLVIGGGEDSETVLYTGIAGNSLTGLTRGFQGTAKAWGLGVKVGRFFTAYDHEAFKANIEDHYNQIGSSPPATPANLSNGLQVVSAGKTAPYNVLNIAGRTLVNLLGRDGNCEDVSKWGDFQTTHALDATNKTIGNYGFKVTILTSTSGAANYHINGGLKANKFYILVADVKNGNATNVRVSWGGTDGQGLGDSSIVTSTSAFQTVYVKANPTTDKPLTTANLTVTGAIAQYGYFDAVCVYEISAAEYNAIDTMTPAQIAAKFPYVDDVKHVNAPYVIKYGENLLPPFSEWTQFGGAFTNYEIVEPYKIKFTNTSYSYPVVFVDVLANTDYTLSTQSNDGKLRVQTSDQTTTIAVTPSSGINSLTFNTGTNTKIAIELVNNTASGETHFFTNPMLNLGTTAKPFKPRNDDYLFFPDVQLASSVDGTVYDQIFKRDGKYFKQSRFKDLLLDGSLAWSFVQDFTGYKRVYINLGTNVVGSSQKGVKYDGKILGAINAIDGIQLNPDGSLFLDIADVDSGWGDSYTPTAQEIDAFFYGWKMFDASTSVDAPYNGTGTKNWAKIYVGVGTKVGSVGSGVVNNSGTPTLPTSPFSPVSSGFSPYKLTYQLSTPTFEEIQVEGSLSLHEGLNQIEVGQGIIVREKANPTLYTGNGYYYINDVAVSGSNLKNRSSRILQVYKNGLVDMSAKIENDPNAYGTQHIKISPTSYDPTATYEVSYIALDQYLLSAPVQTITGEYASNLKTVVDTVVQNQADIETRVSVLEATKARKVQGQWIAPTLLNGWVNLPGQNNAGYMKDELGFVHIRGMVKSGGTSGTPIFMLPAGYRPAVTLFIPVMSNNGTSDSLARADIMANGEVQAAYGSNNWFDLDSITPFLAE